MVKYSTSARNCELPSKCLPWLDVLGQRHPIWDTGYNCEIDAIGSKVGRPESGGLGTSPNPNLPEPGTDQCLCPIHTGTIPLLATLARIGELRLVEIGKWTLSCMHATGQGPPGSVNACGLPLFSNGSGPWHATPDSWVEANTMLATLRQMLRKYEMPFARAERAFSSLGAHGITLLLLIALLLAVILLE